MMQSYFTRKMTGYLEHKGIPWLFRRFPGASPEAMRAGFPGGVPVLETPTGEFMWDSTAMIHHLERRFPAPSVLPSAAAVWQIARQIGSRARPYRGLTSARRQNRQHPNTSCH